MLLAPQVVCMEDKENPKPVRKAYHHQCFYKSPHLVQRVILLKLPTSLRDNAETSAKKKKWASFICFLFFLFFSSLLIIFVSDQNMFRHAHSDFNAIVGGSEPFEEFYTTTR